MPDFDEMPGPRWGQAAQVGLSRAADDRLSVDVDGNLEAALKRFKRRLDASGLPGELRKRAYALGPSASRRRKARVAASRRHRASKKAAAVAALRGRGVYDRDGTLG